MLAIVPFQQYALHCLHHVMVRGMTFGSLLYSFVYTHNVRCLAKITQISTPLQQPIPAHKFREYRRLNARRFNRI